MPIFFSAHEFSCQYFSPMINHKFDRIWPSKRASCLILPYYDQGYGEINHRNSNANIDHRSCGRCDLDLRFLVLGIIHFRGRNSLEGWCKGQLLFDFHSAGCFRWYCLSSDLSAKIKDIWHMYVICLHMYTYVYACHAHALMTYTRSITSLLFCAICHQVVRATIMSLLDSHV